MRLGGFKKETVSKVSESIVMIYIDIENCIRQIDCIKMICQYYGYEKISTIKVNILFDRSYQSAHLYCKLFCIIPEVKNSIAYSHKDEKICNTAFAF